MFSPRDSLIRSWLSLGPFKLDQNFVKLKINRHLIRLIPLNVIKRPNINEPSSYTELFPISLRVAFYQPHLRLLGRVFEHELELIALLLLPFVQVGLELLDQTAWCEKSELLKMFPSSLQSDQIVRWIENPERTVVESFKTRTCR